MIKHKKKYHRIVLLNSILLLIVLVCFAAIGASQLDSSRAAGDFIVPASITANCSRDVSGDINTWLATVPNSSTIVFNTGACYRIDQTVKIISRSNLIINGNGANFKAMTDGRETPNPQSRIHFLIQSSNNITISRVNVVGENTSRTGPDGAYIEALEGQHGFSVISSNNTTLDTVSATNVHGDFVYMGRQAGTIPTNTVVKNSIFQYSGRQGIAITSANGVLIENNRIMYPARGSVDIEPNGSTWSVNNVTIRSNYFKNGRLLWIANAGACAPITNIDVENNTLDTKGLGVWALTPSGCVNKRGPYKFINNISNAQVGSGTQAVMRFMGVSNVLVSNNKQPMQINRSMHLVNLEADTNDVKVTGNILLNAIGAVAIAKNVTPTNYCYSNNYIKSPLVLEASPKPCVVATVPPPVTPVPADNIQPTIIAPDHSDELAALGFGMSPATDASSSTASNSQISYDTTLPQSQNSQELSMDALSSMVPKTVSAKQTSIFQKIVHAVRDIPATLGEIVSHPGSIVSILKTQEKIYSLIALTAIVVLISFGIELAYFLHKHHGLIRYLWLTYGFVLMKRPPFVKKADVSQLNRPPKGYTVAGDNTVIQPALKATMHK